MRFLVFIVLLVLVCHAYAADEKLTITTYYPSPAGVYKNLRLMPGADPGDCTNANAPIGKLFFNATAGSVYACTQISGSNYGYRPVSQFWALDTNSATVFPVDTSYRVGIGTNSASSKLTVVGGAIELSKQSVAYQPFVNPTTRGQGAEITFWAPDEAAYAPYYWTHNAGRIYGKMPIHDWMGTQLVLQAGNNWDTFVQNQLVLRGNGNVGFGTDNPVAKLHIAYNGSNGSGGYVNYGLVSVAASGQATIGADTSFDGYANLNLGQTVGGVHRFWHLSSRTSANAYGLGLWNFAGSTFSGPHLWVATNGKVGIGTSIPATQLEVADNTAIKVGQSYLSSGGNYLHLARNEWYNGSSWIAAGDGELLQMHGGNFYFYTHNAAGSHTLSGYWTPDHLKVSHAASGGYVLLGAYDGQIEIGSGNDSQSYIDFHGNANLGRDYTGRILYNDNGSTFIYYGRWTSGSDIRLKKDVVDMSGALAKIMRLRAVNFRWKDPKRDTGLELGVIAQEVEQVFPELVKSDKDGIKSVDYPKFSVVLLGALKDQQSEIDSLKDDIESIKAELVSLKKAANAKR